MGDHDGHTISMYVPTRTRPGFGCPHCGKPLPLEPGELLLSAIIGLVCCGYYPTGRQAARWAIAGRLMLTADEIGWKRDERRFGRRG